MYKKPVSFSSFQISCITRSCDCSGPSLSRPAHSRPWLTAPLMSTTPLFCSVLSPRTSLQPAWRAGLDLSAGRFLRGLQEFFSLSCTYFSFPHPPSSRTRLDVCVRRATPRSLPGPLGNNVVQQRGARGARLDIKRQAATFAGLI